MQTELAKRLGIEFPIFAFTHCRDVVAAVSNAGGFGVLGAVGFTPEQLEIECKWIDEHVGDNAYGVDLVIPQKYEGMGELDPGKLEEQLRAAIPAQHREFAAKLLADHGIPEMPPEESHHELLGMSLATAAPQLDVALQHEKVRVIANALGTPPPEVVERVQSSGRLIGALCGKVHQAVGHKEAGLDFIIAQGTEGGGHTGEIGSMVLWPQIIEAVAPVPVLAAGGIATGAQMAAALAMGAQGIWTGSIWLTVQEAECPPSQMASYLNASSGDTVRSRSFTGKRCRMLRNDWTEAWEAADTPDPLGMPLQNMVTMDCITRTSRYASSPRSQEVAFNPVGQVVGMMNDVRSVREVITGIVEEYVDSIDRLSALQPE
ncbi:MAG: nitronate monooxygenase [Deltaproteobacteria bacterium]|nr:nitronate monooxygenase [Deltaproteobacteria bacterium]MBW2498477.1 nitronate monooxygenase [Deltaproteobacteria bacterium]